MLSTAERDQLVEQHLDLVHGIAVKLKKSLGVALPDEDLVAYGSKGLVEAAQRFEQGRGAAFSTFAYYRIRGAMLDGMRTMGWYKRSDVARHRAEERANAYLQSEYDQEPNAGGGNAASALASINDRLSAVAAVSVVSLEADNVPELADNNAVDAGAALTDAQTAKRIREAVAGLPDKEKQLLEAHYFGDKTLLEAGAAMGLSKSWASRLHARAVKLLRKRLQDL